MTTVHVVPLGDEPEHHTLGKCHCGTSQRQIRIGDIFDWIHVHRSLASPDEWDAAVGREPLPA